MSVIASQLGRGTYQQARDEKESVYDSVITLAPQQTPLLAMMNRGAKPGTTKYEWLVDNAGARPTNMTGVSLRGEGADATATATRDRVMCFNRTGIFGDTIGVTFSQQASILHGVNDEVEYQIVENTKERLVDLEFTSLNGTIDADSVTQPNTGTNALHRKTGGFLDMIANPTNYVDTGTLGTTALAYTAAADTTLSADNIELAQQTCAERGGSPSYAKQVFAAGAAKRVVSRLFAPVAGSTAVYRRHLGNPGDDRSIVLPVDVIETDFGVLHMHWHQDMPADTLFAMDPEYCHLMPFRDFQAYELGLVGSQYQYLIEGEFGFRCLAFNTMWRLTSVD